MNITKARSSLVIPLDYPEVLSLSPELVDELGAANALAFSQLIVEQVLRQVLPVDNDYRAWILFRPRERTSDVQKWLAWTRGRAMMEWNEGETRPQRLAHALRHAFDDGAERVLVLDPMSLEIKRSRIEELFAALDENDVLIGPTPEGDVYALATRHPLAAELLEATGQLNGKMPVALAQKLAEHGLEVTMLDDVCPVRHPSVLKSLSPDVLSSLPTKFRHALSLLGVE